jgi:peptidoglycan/xylan/chitin deacetylase (PgdA/CDA1 family)
MLKKIIEEIKIFLKMLLGLYLLFSGKVNISKEEIFSKNYITSLFFHNPSQQFFKRCIQWLKKNGYFFISIDQLIQYVQNQQEFPKGAVWLSIDDGWKDNIHNIIPVINEYKTPITFFIATDPVENQGIFWWTFFEKCKDQLPNYLKSNLLDLKNIKEKDRKKIIQDLKKRCKKRVSREVMEIEEVKSLAQNPLVTIGSHTVHHALTVNCTDNELEFEIKESKEKLQEWTNKEVKYFSYPNGRFDGRERKILKESGYKLAATDKKRFITKNDDLYLMPRIGIKDKISFYEAICKIVGIWRTYISKTKKLLNY